MAAKESGQMNLQKSCVWQHLTFLKYKMSGFSGHLRLKKFTDIGIHLPGAKIEDMNTTIKA